jgi:tetratricopeptide (TPR) repeat protein
MPVRSRSFARDGSVLALSVLVSFYATRSSADPASDPAPSDEAVVEQRRLEAKSKYQDGAAAYSAGHYKDAVDLFLAADRLAPSAPLSFNIARAYEKLGDGSGALRWYRDYLRRNPAAPNVDSVRAVISTLAAGLAKKGVQQLSVLCSPDGATVSIDDQPVGVAPWTGELAPGKHHLLLSRRGYADAERDIELGSTEPIDVSVRLEPETAAAPTTPAPLPVASPANSSPAPAPDASRGPRLGVWPWVTLGASAAALGGALTFEVLRRSAEDDAKHATTQLDYQARLESEQSRQTTARIFLGVGGTLAVAGGVMLLLDSSAKAHPASAGFVCVPELCAVTARGRF